MAIGLPFKCRLDQSAGGRRRRCTVASPRPLFRHPIQLAPPETRASTVGVTVNWSTPGPVFDDRDSPMYATRGYYALGSFRVYPTWLGSDSEWQSFQTDRTGEAF